MYISRSADKVNFQLLQCSGKGPCYRFFLQIVTLMFTQLPSGSNSPPVAAAAKCKLTCLPTLSLVLSPKRLCLSPLPTPQVTLDKEDGSWPIPTRGQSPKHTPLRQTLPRLPRAADRFCSIATIYDSKMCVSPTVQHRFALGVHSYNGDSF